MHFSKRKNTSEKPFKPISQDKVTQQFILVVIIDSILWTLGNTIYNKNYVMQWLL